MIKVVVNYQEDEERLPLVIVESKGSNLLRRDWLMKLKQDLNMINQVRMKEELTALISRYSDIFQNELCDRGVYYNLDHTTESISLSSYMCSSSDISNVCHSVSVRNDSGQNFFW